MGKSGLAAAIFVAMVAGAPGWALADGTLQLVLGGEGFDGPPKFAVTFDGKPVGDGQVAAAIDTGTAGRFADAADQDKYVQDFSFKIPDMVFKANGDVAIRLLNEGHGSAGSRNNRELFVKSIAVNGEPVPASELGMRSADGVEPTAMLGDYLVVSETAVEGVATAPGRGWPMVADAPPAPDPTPADKPAEVITATTPVPAEKPAPLKVAANSTPPAVAPAAPPAPAVDPVAAAPAPAVNPVAAAPAPAEVPRPEMQPKLVAATETTDVTPAPAPDAADGDCGLTQKFQILGFNENSNDLTPRTRKALDAVVKAIGTQKCVVHLTGYSSTEGDFAHNALFSIERAQNALHYLLAQGVKFHHYSANGVGETAQFGANPNANRRVVVTVSP